MPKNKVQFQKGLSLTQFLQDYGSEAQCEQALFAARWPDGLNCPRGDLPPLARGGIRGLPLRWLAPPAADQRDVPKS